MNALEAAQLIDRCIALGIWPSPGDAEMLATQAEAWGEQLRAVPLAYAIEQADRHPGPYYLRPSFIRDAWDQAVKVEKAHITYGERACPNARLCRCTHGIDECNRGFLDTPSDRERGTTAWCPLCWDARNLRREELGKEPVPLTAAGSHR